MFRYNYIFFKKSLELVQIPNARNTSANQPFTDNCAVATSPFPKRHPCPNTAPKPINILPIIVFNRVFLFIFTMENSPLEIVVLREPKKIPNTNILDQPIPLGSVAHPTAVLSTGIIKFTHDSNGAGTAKPPSLPLRKLK